MRQCFRQRTKKIAEAYCLGVLPPVEATGFEDHYMVCNACACIVEDTDGYVRAMCGAALELRGSAKPRTRTAQSPIC